MVKEEILDLVKMFHSKKSIAKHNPGTFLSFAALSKFVLSSKDETNAEQKNAHDILNKRHRRIALSDLC